MLSWFDGHLDLAYLALEKRDMTAPLARATQGPQPPSIVFPSLREGQVRWAMGTIFVVPRAFAAYGYAPGDWEAAHEQGLWQLSQYHAWQRRGSVSLVRSGADWKPDARDDDPLQVLILMEGAEAVRRPDELRWWYQNGVRAVGLSWAVGTQYAGGNHKKGPLTTLGAECVSLMDELGMIHDLSHLSDEAAWMLLERATGPVMASHSNSRSVMGSQSERHLSDELVRAIAQRGGMIGVNLFSQFVSPQGKERRATIAEMVAHIEAICELVGDRRRVGLGSDMDGGFGAHQLVAGIDRPVHLTHLTDALKQRGWTEDELAGFASKNWLQWMQQALASDESVDD